MIRAQSTAITKIAATLATNAMLMMSTPPAAQAEVQTLIADDTNCRITALLTTGKGLTTGSSPRPGKYIMQYLVKN